MSAGIQLKTAEKHSYYIYIYITVQFAVVTIPRNRNEKLFRLLWVVLKNNMRGFGCATDLSEF